MTPAERFEQLEDVWHRVTGATIAARTLVVNWEETSGTLTVLTTATWLSALEHMSLTYIDRMNHALLQPDAVRGIRWELAARSTAA